MRSKLAVAALLPALAWAGAGATGSVARNQPPGPPNFVVVMTDDQNVADLAAMRGTRRYFARNGTEFTRHYATFPLCCPSRASFLTGQYPHNHGIVSNHPPDGGYGEFIDNQPTAMPVALDDAGYRTAMFGKYLNGYSTVARRAPRAHIPPGWDTWRAVLTARLFNWYLNANGKIRRFRSPETGYQTDVLAAMARSFVRDAARRSEPFFAYVAPTAPHFEVNRPPPNPRPAKRHEGAFAKLPLPRGPAFNEADISDKPSFIGAPFDAAGLAALRDDFRARRGTLLAVDELVTRLIETLRDTGELDNTYLIFTSDNGYLLGEHRLKGKSRFYEESARVPFLISGPGIPAGERAEQITGNIDLASTLLAAAGATPLVTQDGIDLRPLAADPQLAADRDILLEVRNHRALRTPGYMYAEYETDPNVPGFDEFELYDMAADPFQLESLHNTFGPGTPSLQTRADLIARLEELSTCAGAGCA